ncbi:hypothetical protein C8R46DRAFT_1030543 [Mycena filopes]|nr:hypothetical protein C8R46DRAFT_1030543 [Mycena filopes]
MSGRISVEFSRSSPLHRDKEAFNDDWNEFNDLGHSANKFRPIGSKYPFGFLFVGKLVRFPTLIAVSSFLFVPVQPLHRDKEAFNDDRNEFNNLDYSANKFGAFNPLVRSNIRSVSCLSYLPRVFVAFRDMDANDLEKYACRRPCTFVPTTPTSPHSTRILVPLCGPHRLGKIGSAYPYALQSPGPRVIKQIPRQAHWHVRSNIRRVFPFVALAPRQAGLQLDYSANKFGASNPFVRSNIRSVSCSSPLHRDKDAFNDD